MNDISKRIEVLILFLCLLAGFSLRFYTFDKKSLWMDEIYTLNDSRYGFKEQIEFYKERPTFPHPPLFFVLTHLLYPFPKPERDLRIIPLIFGTLCIPMFYLLAKQFSPSIPLPCTISLIFMVYHISLSQDARSYSMIMFLGMVSLYFFLRYLWTLKNRYLIPVAILFAIALHISYSSIPFIIFSQILWFYRPREGAQKPKLSSFFLLNGLVFLICLPWILFLMFNYKGQLINQPLQTEGTGSFFSIIYGIFHDWTNNIPLMIISILLFILLPIFSDNMKNGFVLIITFLSSIIGFYLFYKMLNITHFISSKYFISFLPIFLIIVFLSAHAIDLNRGRSNRLFQFKSVFLFFFVLSNLVILNFYYQSEKQDFRGMTKFIKGHVRDRDVIYVGNIAFIPGILHYLGIYPDGRRYTIPFRKISENNIEYFKPVMHGNKLITIYSSKECCRGYSGYGNRLWIVAGKTRAKKLKEETPAVLKGYFDGSFLNFNRFPTDASMYLFLWDPSSPNEKGIDLPIE